MCGTDYQTKIIIVLHTSWTTYNYTLHVHLLADELGENGHHKIDQFGICAQRLDHLQSLRYKGHV